MKNDIKKYEYALDIFKGTCELNNYIETNITYEEKLPKIILPNIDSLSPKSYFHALTFDKKPNYIFGAINKNEATIYTVGEMINMASKVLYHLDIIDSKIIIYSSESWIENLISNLNALDLEVELENKPQNKESFNFEIIKNQTTLVKGGIKDNYTYFQIDYNALESLYDYKIEESLIDAYISVEDKQVLDDAFIIGSNLKDAGFKVEIDYSLKKVTKNDINASFLITFDAKDIEKYEVKLIDMATKELKKVMIDNLIEELAFL